MSEAQAAYPVRPTLLTPERLAEIELELTKPRARSSYVSDYGVAADVVEELLAHAAALTTRAEKAEVQADSLTNYIRAADKKRGQQDTTYVREATRLLKQCRRPELAAAVDSEMSNHGSNLNYLALTQARAEKAEASLIKAKDIVEILLPSNTAFAARAEKAEARVKELQAELAEQEVAKLALVKENQGQRAMIGALDLIRAGYVEKCSQITNLLLTFPEYAQVEKHLLDAARLNAAQ